MSDWEISYANSYDPEYRQIYALESYEISGMGVSYKYRRFIATVSYAQSPAFERDLNFEDKGKAFKEQFCSVKSNRNTYQGDSYEIGKPLELNSVAYECSGDAMPDESKVKVLTDF